MIRTVRTIAAGHTGSLKLQKAHGEDLICVRYRIDENRGIRLKTIELVIERKPWKPQVVRTAPGREMFIRIGLEEFELQSRVKKAGAVWHHDRRLWQLSFGHIQALDLQDRIVSPLLPRR